jgi:hypothetical protein
MPLSDRIDLGQVPPNFWPFPHPVPLSRGDTLPVRVTNTDTELFFDLPAPSDG